MSDTFQKLVANFTVFSLLISFIGLAPRMVFAIDGEVTYTGINTNITGDDSHSGGNQGPYNIGFTFDFYGTNYTQANVNINGVLNMGATYTTGFSNQTLNNAAAFNNSIFAFWDDLNTNGNKIIYYATIGSEPNRKFVVQWTNIYFHGTSIQMGTFQTILYEGTNVVQIQYRDLLGGNRALGNSATIGIKKDSNTYLQYSHDVVSLTAGQAIRYTPDGNGSYTVNTDADYDLIYLAPDGAPTSPTLVNPTDATTGVTLRPTFEWLPVESATSYTVLVSTVSNFSSTVVNQSGVVGTSYTLGSDLNANTQYYWRVQAVNNIGSSLSSTRTFSTGVVNVAPNLPTDITSDTFLGGGTIDNFSGATLNATLSDDDDDEQVRFRLQIATDAAFNQLVLDYRSPFRDVGPVTYTYGENDGIYLVGSSTTTFIPADYYLRIRAEDDAAASSAWYTAPGVAFSVVADEDAPELSGISASPFLNSSVIEWTTNEPASSQIEYGPSSLYTASTTEINISPRVTSHEILIENLDQCITYHFRVLSVDGSGNQAASGNLTFTTKGCTADAVVTAQNSARAATSSVTTVELKNEGRGIGISVPAGFATSSANFQIKKIDDTVVRASTTAPTGRSFVEDHTYTLHAVTDDFTVISEFDEPIIIELTYSEEDIIGINETSLSIFRFDGEDWQELTDCIVDTISNTITCTTDHFSTFSLFGTGIAVTNENESVRVKKVISTIFGCKDPEAINYEFFSAHKQELCKYGEPSLNEDKDLSLQIKELINQHKELFIKAYELGISIPQYILTFLGIGLKSSEAAASFGVRNLTLGDSGDDVRALQEFLINVAAGPSARELARVGATGVFGAYTANALTEYQQSHSIQPPNGYFGPITQNQMKTSGKAGVWW